LKPGALEDWFRGRRESEEGAVLLEDALLGGSFAKYHAYRLRYFLLRTLFVCALHFVEIRILLSAFHDVAFFRALGIRTLLLLVGAAWWAALESMRGEIRAYKRDERPFLIPRVIERWMKLSRRLSIGCAAIVAACAIAVTVAGAWSPFTLFTLACGLRLAVEFSMRTYHSGVYATRRVYRPLHLILGVELLSLVGFLLLRDKFGAWSLGPLVLVTSAVSTYISYHYVRRSYDLMGYSRAIRDLVRKRTRLHKVDLRGSLLAAASFTLFRLDSLVILAFSLGDATSSHRDFSTYLCLVLAMPLLQAAQEWGQLLYFDFKRLELDSSRHLRERFERGLQKLPALLGVALWLPLPVLYFAFLPKGPWMPLALLFALMLPHSFLSLESVRAFSDGRYLRLLGVGALLLATVAGFKLHSTDAGIGPFLVLLSVAVWAAWAALKISDARSRDSKQPLPRPIPLLTWVEALRASSGPVRCARLSVAIDEESSWRAAKLAERLARALIRDGGHVSLVSESSILVFASGTDRGFRSQLLSLGAGWVEKLEAVEEALPAEKALEVLATEEPRLRGALNGRERDPNARFRDLFPRFGVLIELPSETAAAPSPAAGKLSAGERRELLSQALRFLKKLPDRPDAGVEWDVTAWGRSGRLESIYALPVRSVPRFHRDRWRQWITQSNIRTAWKERDDGNPSIKRPILPIKEEE
jgi:hypothetical protein